MVSIGIDLQQYHYTSRYSEPQKYPKRLENPPLLSSYRLSFDSYRKTFAQSRCGEWVSRWEEEEKKMPLGGWGWCSAEFHN